MVRLQLILGLLLSLVLATSAVAQNSEGTFDSDGGGSTGNANSGSGSVPTATPAPKRAPTRAPAPAATRAPVATPMPTVAAPAPARTAPAPKATAEAESKGQEEAEAQARQAKAAEANRRHGLPLVTGEGGAPAPSGRRLRRQDRIAALDLSRARVRTLQRSGAARLLSDRPACADDKQERELTATAVSLKADQTSPPQAAAGGSASIGQDLDLTPKQASGPSELVLLIVGFALLLLVVGYQLRKQFGLSTPRQPTWPPRRSIWRR